MQFSIITKGGHVLKGDMPQKAIQEINNMWRELAPNRRTVVRIEGPGVRHVVLLEEVAAMSVAWTAGGLK